MNGLTAIEELEASGLSRVAIGRKVEAGQLLRLDRGVYGPASFEPTEHHSLALVGIRSPKAVVALTSAAVFHGLTTQMPESVWIALPPGAWAPTLETVSVRVVRFSGARYEDAIEQHTIERVETRIYSAAKTVVDLFRYRNKLGLDVAIESLRAYVRRQDASVGALAKLAERSGVLTPIRPYLEAVA